jgi:transposase InsO family protein
MLQPRRNIERFYNPRRRHSTIGYMSPMQFNATLVSCAAMKIEKLAIAS